MTHCPFCMSEIHEQAVVCAECSAVKGYWTRDGRVFNNPRTLRIGAAILAVVAVGGWIAFEGSGLGWVLAALFGLPAVYNWWLLKRGPRWYR